MSAPEILTRELQLDATRAEGDLIPCTIATSNPVRRDGVQEVLDCTPAGVDLSRAPLPLIVSHDRYALAVGLVESLPAEAEAATVRVRFGTRPEAQAIAADVRAGIHRSLSVGYQHLDEGTVRQDGAIVYRWMPYETSVVSVPADPQAGFYRNFQGNPMTAINTQERAEIAQLLTRHNVPQLSDRLQGASLDQAKSAVLEELAARDFASGGHRNVRPLPMGNDAERQAIENTLVRRLGGRVEGETLRGGMVDLAARSLELQGQRILNSDSRDRILARALQTTGDFSNLLGSAVGRVLHDAFNAAPAALKAVARQVNLPDFRDRTVVRLGEAPSLELVNEHGEFKYGAVSDTGNAWRLYTYGRILGLTRQALVNDDLDAFSSLLRKFGESAARREAEELVKVLTSPPAIDGSALFAAGRNNLKTGAGSALDFDGLADAVKALRLQSDLDGGLITQEPGFLVVPAALEMTARQLTSTSYTPATTSAVQPYGMQVVVEPRLDALSATAWYLVARNQSAMEFGYLEDAQGMQITQREGFEVDGMEIKARLDFGAGWASPVGWVKNAGA